LIELDQRALRLREVECPYCKARILFRRVPIPRIDELGFKSHAFNCNFCRSCLVWVIDPWDGALLLSIVADKVERSAAPTYWDERGPLLGSCLRQSSTCCGLASPATRCSRCSRPRKIEDKDPCARGPKSRPQKDSDQVRFNCRAGRPHVRRGIQQRESDMGATNG
jgi:hypothetical protein